MTPLSLRNSKREKAVGIPCIMAAKVAAQLLRLRSKPATRYPEMSFSKLKLYQMCSMKYFFQRHYQIVSTFCQCYCEWLLCIRYNKTHRWSFYLRNTLFQEVPTNPMQVYGNALHEAFQAARMQLSTTTEGEAVSGSTDDLSSFDEMEHAANSAVQKVWANSAFGPDTHASQTQAGKLREKCQGVMSKVLNRWRQELARDCREHGQRRKKPLLRQLCPEIERRFKVNFTGF